MKYPLLFSFRDLIAGKGFVAGVVVDGRVLLEEEGDGEVWMYGVQPGGVAGGGPSRDAAFREFKNRYISVLYDVAQDADSFAVFEREVTAFFNTVSDGTGRDWEAALAEVRRTQASLPGVPTMKAEDRTPTLQIILIDETNSRPSANALDQFSEAA